jgi:hypothetical protein
MGVRIERLASIQTVEHTIDPQEEPRLVAQAVDRVREEARWLLLSRLNRRQVYNLVTVDDTDRALSELGAADVERLSPEQLTYLGRRLGADVFVRGVIQDYGKVRESWLAAGMLADLTWESVALGLATHWNPAAIFGNIGFELLTSTPVWFGGGYLFGVAFRPVRVEVSVISPDDGTVIWRVTEVAMLIRGRLKQVPEKDRRRKEVQLRLNLAAAMEAIGDALADAAITQTVLRARRLPDEQTVSF